MLSRERGRWRGKRQRVGAVCAGWRAGCRVAHSASERSPWPALYSPARALAAGGSGGTPPHQRWRPRGRGGSVSDGLCPPAGAQRQQRHLPDVAARVGGEQHPARGGGRGDSARHGRGDSAWRGSSRPRGAAAALPPATPAALPAGVRRWRGRGGAFTSAWGRARVSARGVTGGPTVVLAGSRGPRPTVLPLAVQGANPSGRMPAGQDG